MPAPAPTPAEKTLNRVLFISGFDGWSVIVIAALGGLLTLLLGDLSGLLVGVLAAAAGVIELRGRARLRRRDAGGMRLLVRAQLMLLTVILVYCAARLGSFDSESVMGNLTPEMEAMLKENGVQRADVLPLVRLAFYLTYSLVAFFSLLFQGGLALYYRSRTVLVTAALTEPPRQPPLA